MSDINKIVVSPESDVEISACGRADASSGTEGTIDLFDEGTKICTLYWSSPWGAYPNIFQAQDVNGKEGYIVGVGPYGTSGALGRVEVEIAKKVTFTIHRQD